MTARTSKRLRAVIFDFDGVIVDTEPLHFQTLAETLSEAGITITEAEYRDVYIVFDDESAIRTAFDRAGRDLSRAELTKWMEVKAERFIDCIKAGIPLFPGVKATIRALREEFPLTIASGALSHEIDAILDHHDLREEFLGVIAADDVEQGKPHPESYWRAATIINDVLEPEPPIDYSECLVIEDTVNGVNGAKQAGMQVLAVTNSYPANALTDADAVIDTLEGLTPAKLRALMK